MDAVINAAIAEGRLTKPFDLIVHSTGGLVAREWLSRYYPNGKNAGGSMRGETSANPGAGDFGSKLASMGKRMVGRVIKGWDSWFQTGTEMLASLELASSYQWELARRDLLKADGGAGESRTAATRFGRSSSSAPALSGRPARNRQRGRLRWHRATGSGQSQCDRRDDRFLQERRARSDRMGSRSDIRFPFAVLPDRDHTAIHQPTEKSGAADEFSNRLADFDPRGVALRHS